MAVFLAGIAAISAIVLVALMIAFARRLRDLTRAMSALQKELIPALEAIQQTSRETQELASQLEERARVLRGDGK
jgi:Sec-independent protein translocase protein TatA